MTDGFSGGSLPHDLNMESALLGAAMQDLSALGICLGLKPSDFFRESNRALFEAIAELSAQGKRVHLTTVAYMLQTQGTLEMCGGEPMLQQHIDRGVVTSSADYYAQIIREKSELRRLIQAGQILQSLPYRDGLTVEQIREKAESAVMEALAPAEHQGGLQPAGVFLKSVMAQYQEQEARGDGLGGFSTGFNEIDFLTSGFTVGNLILVAARPSIGKTALVSRIAVHFARHHGAVLFFSMDTGGVSLMQRIAAMEGRIDSMGLRSGTLWPEEKRALQESADRLSALPLFVDERAAMTAGYVRREARRLRVQHAITLIVVDYVQMMDGAATDRREENRNQELSSISRALKQLGRELECPVIALSQLNRQVENRPNRRPQLSDLRDSGGLEAEADIVMGLYRDEYYKAKEGKEAGYTESPVQQAEVNILKQKNGPTGVAHLAFVGKCLRFENLEKRFDEPGVTLSSPVSPSRFARPSPSTTKVGPKIPATAAVDMDAWNAPTPRDDPFADDAE